MKIKFILLLSIVMSLHTTISTTKKVLFFIGPPSSGKSSAAKYFVKNYGYGYISTENICKNLTTMQNTTGKQIKSSLERGELVPDNIILPIVEKQLEKTFKKNDCVIFESFPRTITQARFLEQLLKEKYYNTEFIVVRFLASYEVITERIKNRYVCPKCNKSYIIMKNSPLVPKKYMTCDHCHCHLTQKIDDKTKPIKKRFETFLSYEKKLIEFYKKLGKKIIEYRIKLSTYEPLEKQFIEILNLF